jgi:hypothetical protein
MKIVEICFRHVIEIHIFKSEKNMKTAYCLDVLKTNSSVRLKLHMDVFYMNNLLTHKIRCFSIILVTKIRQPERKK